MAGIPPPSKPLAKPGKPVDLSESVAGEEDPGASIDIADTDSRQVHQRKQGDRPEVKPPQRPA